MYLSDSELIQLNLLKKKSPLERFIMMAQLIGNQFEFMKAGLKYRNPDINDEELKQCLKDKLIKIYTLKH